MQKICSDQEYFFIYCMNGEVLWKVLLFPHISIYMIHFWATKCLPADLFILDDTELYHP